MKDNTVVRLSQPGEVEERLTAVLRAGARNLLSEAIDAKVTECVKGRFEQENAQKLWSAI